MTRAAVAYEAAEKAVRGVLEAAKPWMSQLPLPVQMAVLKNLSWASADMRARIIAHCGGCETPLPYEPEQSGLDSRAGNEMRLPLLIWRPGPSL